MLPKRLIVLLMSLCTLCGAASAVQPRTDLTQKEQKALQLSLIHI